MTETSFPRLSWRTVLLTLCASIAGCAVYEQPSRPSYGWDTPDYPAYSNEGVTRVYVDPPLMQPEPIMVEWAPPPLLAEMPPPMPFYGAVWIGGYWIWQDGWIWASGRWRAPPQPHYQWMPPYYEHRGGMVVFISGFWAAPGVVFMPPPPTARITMVRAPARIGPRPRPVGPPGVFIPPPPGSRPGLIVPAPVGTAPGVLSGAPPVVQPGMRVHPAPRGGRGDGSPEFTVVAPPGATRSGRAFERVMPGQPRPGMSQQPADRSPSPWPRQPDRSMNLPTGPTPFPSSRTPGRPEMPGQPWPRERSIQGEPPNERQPSAPVLRGERPWPAPDGAPIQRRPYNPPPTMAPGNELRQPSPAQPPDRAGLPGHGWPRERAIQGEPRVERQPSAPELRGERRWSMPDGAPIQRQPYNPPPTMAPGNEPRHPPPARIGRQEAPTPPQPRATAPNGRGHADEDRGGAQAEQRPWRGGHRGQQQDN